MTTLRVILDEVLGGGAVGRYTEELTREIVRIAPRGCYVEGFVSASTETEYADLPERIPGLALLHKSPLALRELRAAWQHGFTRLPGTGVVHAPSPLAPLARHDRLNDGDQIAVTFHETLAWTNPEAVGSRGTAWAKGMAKRAQKYADAIVVPSHAVAERLADFGDFGDRIRIVSGAPSSTLKPGADADERAKVMGLPERYLLASAGTDLRSNLAALLLAMKRLELPLLVIGVGDDALAAAEPGTPADRLRGLGQLPDADLAVLIARATVFVYPNLEEDFGMHLLDAFALGVPVIHSDAPAHIELAAESGLTVAREDAAGYSDRLADAVTSVLHDGELAQRLRYLGLDRANAYSWRSSAEKIWQLHADL
jgi:glycosyltransferase involved in cell wall biosynthesis